MGKQKNGGAKQLKKRFWVFLCVVLWILLCSAAAGAESFTLPSELTFIDSKAFYQNQSLSKVIVPDKVTEIQNLAFAYSSLQEIELPASLVAIMEDAFAGCEGLKITAPVGSYAARWAIEHGYMEAPPATSASFFTTAELENGTLSIIGYSGTDVEIVIPATIDGKQVTMIGESAFESNRILTGVTIPEGVTVIDEFAFLACRNLKNVHLPSTLQELRTSAFNSCDLTSLSLPEGLTTISDLVFAYNDSLISIHIPASVTSLNTTAFYDCTSMRSFTLAEGNTAYKVVDDLLFTSDERDLLLWLPQKKETSFTVSDQWLTGPVFQWARELKSVVLPVDMAGLDADTFLNCVTLTSINLSETIDYLGCYHETDFSDCCFDDCPNLTATVVKNSYAHRWCVEHDIPVVFEDISDLSTSVEYFDTEELEDGTLSITGYTGSEARIAIPGTINGKTVTQIGSAAFEDNDKLTIVHIPDSITVINQEAFSFCRSLFFAPLPPSLEEIGAWAFNQCNNLAEISLPEGLKTIGNGAFSGCENVISMHIPASVIEIGELAFPGTNGYEDFKLESITLASGNKTYKVVNNVLFSADGSELLLWLPPKTNTTYTVPSGVVNICGGAFQYAQKLKSITMPDSLETIGDCAFLDCISLESISFPNSMTSIGGNAFESCSSLKTVILPEGLTVIEWATFAYCESLETVVLPQSIQLLVDQSFSECAALSSINLPENLSSIDDDVFDNSPNVTATVAENSYAHTWCLEHNIDCTFAK